MLYHPLTGAAVGACPNLKHFAASQCNDLVELTVSHPTLQRIFLDYNRSLAEITIKCPALTHMGLQRCWRLTKGKAVTSTPYCMPINKLCSHVLTRELAQQNLRLPNWRL